MAGMLTVTSIAPVQAMAAEEEVLEEAATDASSDAASEASSELTSDEEADDSASEASSDQVVDEATGETSEPKKEEEAPVKEDEEPGETNETVDTLEFFNRWNESDKRGNKLEFTSQYQEFCYDFGEAFDTDACGGITIQVADQGNNVCFKLYDSGMNEMQAGYSNSGKTEYTVVPTYDGDVKYLGVMSMASGDENYPYSITIKDIKADVKEKVYEETYTYTPSSMFFKERWEGAEVEGNTLEYDAEWQEYWFALGRKFDCEKLKAIKVKVSDQSLTVAFKLYSEDGTELEAFYGKSGAAEYNLYPSCSGEANHFAVMAMNNNTLPGSVTIDEVSFTVDTTPAEEEVEKGVEYDIVNLRDKVEDLMGEDFIIGTAISYMEFADSMEMELVTKHFNGCTLGNELKPDSMLKASAEIKTYELNGEEIQFPELTYETPERYLDFFVNWNNEHPDKKIRIRGHVLVWHSQTPEFFFHEDYDTNKPYVTPDVMNKRLEFYIKSVAEHFTAEGSKYRDLFYGWDVVNEAVSDGTGTYRNGSENSSWWRVYNSPEFIQNAFVYANKYMPADIALFYNDYNEHVASKVKGICALLEGVKATPGARIDGMGMQGHYQVASNDPTVEQIKNAALAYSKIVDQIQITELDFKGSKSSTDERLAERYGDVYDTLRRLKNEGVNVTGMTIWGVVDKHSWLQTSNSAGGGASGNSRQYPLLFDNNYKAKNAFYAIADAGELMPEKKNVTLVQLVDDDFSAGEEYVIKMNDGSATFVPMWTEDGVAVKVTVKDFSVEDTDKVTLYVTDGSIKSATVTRSEATELESGYEAVLKLNVDPEKLALNEVKLDVVVTDGEMEAAYADTQLKQSERTDYYAETVLKPLLAVGKGTVVIDPDAAGDQWAAAKAFPVAINGGAEATATAKVLWDEDALYVRVDVKDAVLNNAASDAWEQDSVEVFIDENNNKSTAYEDDDKQYRISFVNDLSFNGTKCTAENVTSNVTKTEDGYTVEAAFRWTDITPEAGNKVGFDIQVNDADNSGKRTGTLNWADKSGNGWSSPSVFGTITLSEAGNVPTPEVPTPGEPEPEVPEVPEGKLVCKWGSWYYVLADGSYYTGLLTLDGQTYFFKNTGARVVNTTVDFEDGKRFFGSDSAMVTGFFTKWGTTYYANEDGILQTGFVTVDGKTYYCKSNSAIVKSDYVTVDGDRYYLGSDGVLATGFYRRWTATYFADEEGKLQTGFIKVGDDTYYAKDNGTIVKDNWVTVDGNKYYFRKDGTMVTGEFTKWGKKYFFDENGVLQP
jgi:endo-1,4-beta-xylanase